MHPCTGMPTDTPTDTQTAPDASATTPSTAPRNGAPTSSRALQFARRHPALTVVGAGGVALLGGMELALGVLLGAGITMLVRKRGPGRASAQSAAEPSPPMAEASGAPMAHEERGRTPPPVEEGGAPHEEHHRTRELLQRAPEVWKRRARAVVQAARGKLEPQA